MGVWECGGVMGVMGVMGVCVVASSKLKILDILDMLDVDHSVRDLLLSRLHLAVISHVKFHS